MTKIFLIVSLFYTIAVTSTAGTRCANKTDENISDYTQAAIITSLLNNAKNILEEAKSYAVLKTSCSMPIDCAAILEANTAAQSGIYRIWPRSRAIDGFIEVYCDMDDDGGAWTLIQKRGDFDSGKEYFYRDWDAYKNGFGHLEKDFWLGNDKIFAVTNQRLNTVKFVLRDFERNTTYATYDDFWIEDEIRNYTLHVSGYRGTAGERWSQKASKVNVSFSSIAKLLRYYTEQMPSKMFSILQLQRFHAYQYCGSTARTRPICDKVEDTQV